MGNLTNKYIKDTYDGLIKLKDEYNGVKPELQPLQDGLGNDLPAQVSTTEFIITGSLQGNATSADTATSSSHALEADNASTASYVLGSNVDGPVQDAVSSSYAVTASYSLNAGSDTYVTGATFDTNTGIISIKQTEGEPDVTVSINGRFVTLTQGQSTDLRLDFIEYATASLEAFTSSQEIINSEFVNDISGLSSQTGSYLVTGSVAGNVITLEKQDGSTFPLTVTVDPADLPAGLVSGSSQIILQDTTGNLSGSRISGPVLDSVNSVSSSHAIYAETAGTAITSEYSNNTVVYGKNLDASTITKGTPLYFTDSGTSGNLVGVYPADAGNPSRMPAGGIAGEDMIAGAEGVILLDGFINGVSTTGFNAGDIVYVGVGGGYTNQRPTGSNGGGQPNKVQELGYIQKVDATNGSGVIKGPGISNDIPNILEGHFFVGNSDLVATPTSTGSFARRDEVNTFTQNQIINGNLTVNAQDPFPFTVTSGSQAINITMQEFGGSTQPTIFFSGDNSYFQADGNFSIENSPGGQGTGSISVTTNGFLGLSTNGTGSENISLTTATGTINMNAGGGTSNLILTGSNFSVDSSKVVAGGTFLYNRNQLYNSGSITLGTGVSTSANLSFGTSANLKRFMNQTFNYNSDLSGQAKINWYDYGTNYWDSEFGWSTSKGLDGSNKVFYLQAGANNGSSGNVVWWTGDDGYWHILKDMKVENSVEITGSLTTNGISDTETSINGTQVDIITVNEMSASYTGNPAMPYNHLSVQRYGGVYNGYLFEQWDSPSYIQGSDFCISPQGFLSTVATPIAGGSMGLVGSNNGSLTGSITAPTINIGKSGGSDDINIGYHLNNANGTVNIGNNIINVGNAYTDILTLRSDAINVTGSINFQDTVNLNGGSNLYGSNIVDGGGQFFVNGYFQANGQTELTNGVTITGSTIVSGSVDISGSLTTRGISDTETTALGGQVNIINVDGMIAGWTGNPAMPYNHFSVQQYGGVYNGYLFEQWDSAAYTQGSDFCISPYGFFSNVFSPIGGANMGLTSNAGGGLTGSITAPTINIGKSGGSDNIFIGYHLNNANGSVNIGNNIINVGNIYTDSLTLRSDAMDVIVAGNINMNSPKVNIQTAMNLAQQDPLPTGVLGDMAVSSSAELYFHNGSAWTLIS